MSSYCKNCSCDSCYAQRKVPCMQCRRMLLSTALNEWNRCEPCEIEHVAWLRGLEERGMYRKSVSGEWSRHATTEKEAFAADVAQPVRKDGTIDGRFVKKYGTKSLQKELKMSKKQIHEHVERYG